ncbi:IS1 family transposase, partial [Shigella boydii]|uniref:IS1 family transposase n=1 Tax=Shigella boydii TaxID=621 RepID=UPI002093597B
NSFENDLRGSADNAFCSITGLMATYGGQFTLTHLARLGRKSLSFSKSVELHDKVIGHYLNIKHYQ